MYIFNRHFLFHESSVITFLDHLQSEAFYLVALFFCRPDLHFPDHRADSRQKYVRGRVI